MGSAFLTLGVRTSSGAVLANGEDSRPSGQKVYQGTTITLFGCPEDLPVFRSSSILHSHQRCGRVPVSPHPCSHLIFSVLF